MKLLPFPEIPIFQSYHNKAFPFGIVQANNTSDIEKWACTKCINCVFTPYEEDHMFDVITIDPWGQEEGLIEYRDVFFDKYLLKQPNYNLLSLIRRYITQGYYVAGLYNEKYIPGKWAFERIDYYHDFLIIGFDKENFISVGYLSDGRFHRYDIPNRNMYDSLTKTLFSKMWLILLKYNCGNLPIPNIDILIAELDNYISTADQLTLMNTPGNSFGIATMGRLKDFFVAEVKENNRIYMDRRYTRVLYEHKWVLTKVVENFLDNDKKQKIYEVAFRNYQRAKSIHMLGLKMQYTQNGKLIDNAETLMNEIIYEETEYIPELINELKKKYYSKV